MIQTTTPFKQARPRFNAARLKILDAEKRFGNDIEGVLHSFKNDVFPSSRTISASNLINMIHGTILDNPVTAEIIKASRALNCSMELWKLAFLTFNDEELIERELSLGHPISTVWCIHGNHHLSADFLREKVVGNSHGSHSLMNSNLPVEWTADSSGIHDLLSRKKGIFHDRLMTSPAVDVNLLETVFSLGIDYYENVPKNMFATYEYMGPEILKCLLNKMMMDGTKINPILLLNRSRVLDSVEEKLIMMSHAFNNSEDKIMDSQLSALFDDFKSDFSVMAQFILDSEEPVHSSFAKDIVLETVMDKSMSDKFESIVTAPALVLA